jgi:hypothetical protein
MLYTVRKGFCLLFSVKEDILYTGTEMEAVQTRVEHPNFETVWAALQEVATMQKETERQMKESSERLNKQLGRLGNRFGEMVEYMVIPNLFAKFRDLGFVFEKVYPDAEIKDKKNNIFTEVDITLENGEKVMIVEVKSKPTPLCGSVEDTGETFIITAPEGEYSPQEW